MIPAGYPFNVGFQWAAPYRFHRIEEVLSHARDSRTKITILDSAKLQTDVVSLPARELIAILRQANPEHNRAVELLLNWDSVLSRESAAAALYEIWIRQLRKDVATQAKVTELVDDWSLEKVLEQLLQAPTAVFGTNSIANRNKLLMNSLDAAWNDAGRLMGPDPKTWSWGRLHTMEFHHSLDKVTGAKQLLDPQSVARPGDGDTVNATWFGSGSFEQQGGASYREILDTGDWDHSLAVNTPGQSGQPGSPHYSDLLPLWDKGEYFPLLYSRDAVEKDVKDRLILEPQ
jgi:penicillin amidase